MFKQDLVLPRLCFFHRDSGGERVGGRRVTSQMMDGGSIDSATEPLLPHVGDGEEAAAEVQPALLKRRRARSVSAPKPISSQLDGSGTGDTE
ncbi:MAG: hypothetical protein JWM42_3258 [Burkholderia sp.]|nr:hypothetical protein [Burkholderia sp.]